MTIYKLLFEKLYGILNLLTTGLFFKAAHGLGGPKMPPPQNMSYISYNDDTWYSYTLPKENHKIYKSRDTPLAFCWHQHFFTENQQILLYQEIKIQIASEHIISNSFNFFLHFFLINMVGILIISELANYRPS